jgi:hypothetical protein
VPLQAEEGYLQSPEPRAARQSGHGSPSINYPISARESVPQKAAHGEHQSKGQESLRSNPVVNLGSAFCEHDTTTRCPTSDCNNARSERMCRTSQACLQPLYGSRVVYRPHSLGGVFGGKLPTSNIARSVRRPISRFISRCTHRCERGLHSALHLFAISNAPHIPIWHCGHAAQCSSSVTLEVPVTVARHR